MNTTDFLAGALLAIAFALGAYIAYASTRPDAFGVQAHSCAQACYPYEALTWDSYKDKCVCDRYWHERHP